VYGQHLSWSSVKATFYLHNVDIDQVKLVSTNYRLTRKRFTTREVKHDTLCFGGGMEPKDFKDHLEEKFFLLFQE
jgi:hypothetical protein